MTLCKGLGLAVAAALTGCAAAPETVEARAARELQRPAVGRVPGRLDLLAEPQGQARRGACLRCVLGRQVAQAGGRLAQHPVLRKVQRCERGAELGFTLHQQGREAELTEPGGRAAAGERQAAAALPRVRRRRIP